MMSPTNGTQHRRASIGPKRSIYIFCFSRVSGFTLNHFSIHSQRPIQPMPKENTLPSQLPRVPAMRQPIGFLVAASMLKYRMSELKGNIVAARKVPRNNPNSPRLVSHVIYFYLLF